jgi:hypothetical protein
VNSREDIEGRLARPRSIHLNEDVWRAAAILAGLRRAVNDRHRDQIRDRGVAKNWLADLWGVIGEIVALRHLQEITDAPISHRPIDFARSVQDVDLRVQLADGELLLEAKAHLLQPGKRYFLINEEAHYRSTARGAVGYVPVLTALGAERAMVGRPLSVQEVDGWSRPPLALRDPARGVALGAIAERCCDVSLEQLEQKIGPGRLVAEAALRREADAAGRRPDVWQPALARALELSAKALVDEVLGVRARLSDGAESGSSSP